MTGKTADPRFKHWAKTVKSVDPEGKNGYAFVGHFINDGTVKIDTARPQLALVSFQHGSRKYTFGEYAIVKIDTNGELVPTAIKASTADGKGWALRIRDATIALLAELSGEPFGELAQYSDEQLLNEIDRRGLRGDSRQ